MYLLNLFASFGCHWGREQQLNVCTNAQTQSLCSVEMVEWLKVFFALALASVSHLTRTPFIRFNFDVAARDGTNSDRI